MVAGWKTVVLIFGVLIASNAHASLITFEDRPAGPAIFAVAGPAQTLVYTFGAVTATFTGGVILTDETSQTTDLSNVYATASAGDPSLTNPLTVLFNQPIENFQIQILNAIAGNYTLEDNVGNSLNFTLATTGGSIATEGFAATGDQITILFDGPPVGAVTFDFAIDNVTFDQPLGTGAPEPGTIATFSTGLFAILGLYLRSRKSSKLILGTRSCAPISTDRSSASSRCSPP